MDLVVDQMVQLEHVDVAHGDLAIERVAGASVEQIDLTRGVEPGERQHVRHVLFTRAIEHRRRHRHAVLQVLGQFDDLVAVPRLDLLVILLAVHRLEAIP